jgi:hypothetical protein
METSASFEARYAPWFYPTGTGDRPGHPVETPGELPLTGPPLLGNRIFHYFAGVAFSQFAFVRGSGVPQQGF